MHGGSKEIVACCIVIIIIVIAFFFFENEVRRTYPRHQESSIYEFIRHIALVVREIRFERRRLCRPRPDPLVTGGSRREDDHHTQLK